MDDATPAPAPAPLPLSTQAAQQLQQWQQLHAQLLELHAALEYTRLMLRLSAARR